MVAGFGGVVLLAVNYRKQRVAEGEHGLAVERAVRETVQGFNERLGTAAEQLAHTSPAVRLTGVYALAGLADDWVDKRQVCVDVLCGYLRIEPDPAVRGEAEVREAILRVIRERTSVNAVVSWSSLSFDFSGMTFENADFARLSFTGTVVFDGAEFSGDLTSFTATTFGGQLSCHGTRFAADLTTFAGAQFEARRLEFVGAEFVGEAVEFVEATLHAPTLVFYRCRFATARVDFASFTIRIGQLRIEECDFTDLELGLSEFFSYQASSDGWSSRLTVEDSRLVRCRIDLTAHEWLPRMYWFVRTVLDTVTLIVDEPGDEPAPWLNVRDVVLRGGTELPERYVRRWDSA